MVADSLGLGLGISVWLHLLLDRRYSDKDDQECNTLSERDRLGKAHV